jgi:hypothetical protein
LKNAACLPLENPREAREGRREAPHRRPNIGCFQISAILRIDTASLQDMK